MLHKTLYIIAECIIKGSVVKKCIFFSNHLCQLLLFTFFHKQKTLIFPLWAFGCQKLRLLNGNTLKAVAKITCVAFQCQDFGFFFAMGCLESIKCYFSKKASLTVEHNWTWLSIVAEQILFIELKRKLTVIVNHQQELFFITNWFLLLCICLVRITRGLPCPINAWPKRVTAEKNNSAMKTLHLRPQLEIIPH